MGGSARIVIARFVKAFTPLACRRWIEVSGASRDVICGKVCGEEVVTGFRRVRVETGGGGYVEEPAPSSPCAAACIPGFLRQDWVHAFSFELTSARQDVYHGTSRRGTSLDKVYTFT